LALGAVVQTGAADAAEASEIATAASAVLITSETVEKGLREIGVADGW
jgi:hypothetical protein